MSAENVRVYKFFEKVPVEDGDGGVVEVETGYVDSFDPKVVVARLFNQDLSPWDRWISGTRLLNAGCATEREVGPVMKELAKSLDGKVLSPSEW